jgi:hypothetical protein
MENLKRYRWPLLMVAVALLGYRLFFAGSATSTKNTAPGIERFPYPTDRLQESQGEYILKEIQEGKIDLSLELVRLRRDCAGELDEAQCHDKIRQLIQDLPGKDKARLLEIFEQYLQFEEKMRQNLPANFAQLTNQEKIQTHEESTPGVLWRNECKHDFRPRRSAHHFARRAGKVQLSRICESDRRRAPAPL